MKQTTDLAAGRAAPPHSGWLTFGVCFLLAAMVWMVFGQTVHFEFVSYDDPVYVCINPAIIQGLSWWGIVWIFSHANANTWFPLTDLSHQLDWQLFGAHAGGHHLTNVLLHAATAILLFLVLRKITGGFWRAAFVAAVFAVHPLRAESVAWVTERKDVLSGFFFMLTLWAWARYLQNRSSAANPDLHPVSARAALNPRRWTLDYYLALIFFALGLMSKSMLVTVPFVLLLLDYWPLNRLSACANGPLRSWLKTWLGLLLEKIPFLILSAADCVATVLTQKNAFLIAQNLTPFGRIGNALLAYTDYLGHMIYPAGLTVSYLQPQANPAIGRVIFSALLLLGISAGVWIGRRKHPYLVVGWFWYLGMLLPVIDIMQASHNARADRYTYLPQIGLALLLTWGAAELCAAWRLRRIALGFAAAAILVALSVDAHIQTSFWKNSLSLWTRAVDCTPANPFAEINLGATLAAQGNTDEAIKHFERTLQLQSDYPEAEVDLGNALASQGKPDEAIAHFARALQLNPYSAAAHYNLGKTLASQGKLAEAIRQFEQALQYRTDYSDAQYDLGLALAIQGKWAEAIPHYEQALHVKMDDTDARYVSAGALADQKKWDQAIELYRQVLQAKPDSADAQNKLAIALVGEGKSAEALPHFRQALTLATAQGDAALAETIRSRLKSYPLPLPQSQTP